MSAESPAARESLSKAESKAAVRVRPKTYAVLKAASDSNRRSVSEEIETRLEESSLSESLQDIRRDIKDVSTNIQKLTAANLTTSPPVITAASLTLKSETDLLDKALARIDELEKAQTLNEEMIERAVLRALAKTHITIGHNLT